MVAFYSDAGTNPYDGQYSVENVEEEQEKCLVDEAHFLINIVKQYTMTGNFVMMFVYTKKIGVKTDCISGKMIRV